MRDPIDRQDVLRKMESVMDMQELYLPVHFKEWVIDECPTVDAVPVVRCSDCVHYIKHDKRCGIWNHGGIVPYGFCFLGERRTDEETIHQYHERHKEVLKEMSMPVGRNVMDALRERRTDENNGRT